MFGFIECVEWLGACSDECGAQGEFYNTIVNFLVQNAVRVRDVTHFFQLGEND